MYFIFLCVANIIVSHFVCLSGRMTGYKLIFKKSDFDHKYSALLDTHIQNAHTQMQHISPFLNLNIQNALKSELFDATSEENHT